MMMMIVLYHQFLFFSCILYYVACAFVICLINKFNTYLLTYLLTYNEQWVHIAFSRRRSLITNTLFAVLYASSRYNKRIVAPTLGRDCTRQQAVTLHRSKVLVVTPWCVWPPCSVASRNSSVARVVRQARTRSKVAAISVLWTQHSMSARSTTADIAFPVDVLRV